MTDAIRLSGVCKRFGDKVAVAPLDLVVSEGSIHGFLGPNGSGKTTTIRMITGLLGADSGTIEVLGRAGGAGASPEIGYLPEERGLYRGMTVVAVLDFFARLKGVRKPRQAVLDWLERLDLAEAANLRVEALSKGMAQRVQFIASVAHGPRLAVLDEPFSGLDPVHGGQLMKAVLDLRANGTTVVLSTHDLTVAQRLCTHVFMIHKGRKVLDGPLDALLGERGGASLRVTTREPVERMPPIAGVVASFRDGMSWDLRLAPDADPSGVARQLIAVIPLAGFTTGTASLADIFFREVGGRDDGTTGQGA
ncbi:MAG: ATP-binding cassette domain-containing protein [Planctomycetes bacterium]|nr:ATP-binding cassette domain-containing protein [Planctomycetota bacterium]